MYNDIKNNKLQRFINDESTSNFVYEVLRDTFLKSKGQKDVQILAAERLALDFLNDAWKELIKFKETKDEKSTGNKQIGL